MKITSVADFKAHLSSYLDGCQEDPVLITRHGKPVALVTPLSGEDDEELYRLLLAHSPKLRRLFQVADERAARGEAIEQEQFWREVEESG